MATLTNAGPEALDTRYVRLEAVVVEPGTTTPLALDSGPHMSEVETTSLQPGSSASATFTGGTAPCDPDVGHTLPPGQNQYRVLVLVPRAPELDEMQPVGFWSEPAVLTVR